jgi:thiamine-phosphate pyrophosphorylase
VNRYELTAGAQRALQAASAWVIEGPAASVPPMALVCGLLAEPDCRAAKLLASHGIDQQAVLQRWPALVNNPIDERARQNGASPAVRGALLAAHEILAEFEDPVCLATEHLLLGLAAAPGEVATWLATHGLDAASIEAEVHRLAGRVIDRSPVVVDWDTCARSSIAAAPPSPTADLILPQAANLKPQASIYRVLDAAANRAGEGLRVVEDYVRFVLDDRHLTERLKQLRHELAAALLLISPQLRLAARDTPGDVGVTITHRGEQTRDTPSDVAAASCKRAQQALRSLEEFAKTVSSEAASRFERLRYDSYTVERAVFNTAANLERLADARLYVLLDGGASLDTFVSLAKALVAAEVDIVQLRDKTLADRELIARARALAALARGSRTLFIMNDRPDLAALSGADGVHVGQEELSVRDARSIVGPGKLVGVSTHSLEQARAAVLEGADYIGVGPTFPSRTKEFAAFAGLDFVRSVAAEIRLPAFAIGGIDLGNLPQVIASGLRRVALSGAVTRAEDPGAAARKLRNLLANNFESTPSGAH